MVRVKFVCTAVKKYRHWDTPKGFLYEATFIPVTSGSEENKQFFEATPSGQLNISTIREDHFEPGRSYYLDFSLAE
ncbi:MAG: hypothetical protein K8I29_19720 [Alphaproteobacteria bacterium]|uniref:Uncharacterized protein n=1 Tax=Candidatus Nitrobium versatile TaxID=2884831 RepID=A0A953M3R2_9BACT|nr:hypothetical protein [Candidatus Nitrobium versatile]